MNVVDMDVWMAKKILIPNFNIISKDIISQLNHNFSELCKRPIENTLKELGASSSEEVSLDKVKSDRRELDKIIMGDILGLTDDEQLEVYRAVVKLIKSRIDRAKSVDKKGKIIDGIDMEAIKTVISERIKKENQ